jgi:hypothetical protein
MADQSDVRRIALSLPETTEDDDHFGFSVRSTKGGKHKGLLWAWNEQLEPGEPKVPSTKVIALRVANQYEKDELLAADPDKFFTEKHYNGFPAVLLRLDAVDADELKELITEAWRTLAWRTLVKDFDATSADPS